MPISLDKQFAGKENEVLQAVKLLSVNGAMKQYNLKHKGTFLHWIRQQPSGNLYLTKLAGMSGGEKSKFYREHRATILDCLDIFGEDFTMSGFYINSKEKLDEIVRHNHNRPSSKPTRADRAELKANTALDMAQELLHRVELFELKIEVIAQGERDNRKAINELKDLFGKFSEMVSNRIGNAMITPLLQHLIQIDDNLNPAEVPNPLSVETLISQGEASQAKAGAVEVDSSYRRGRGISYRKRSCGVPIVKVLATQTTKGSGGHKIES